MSRAAENAKTRPVHPDPNATGAPTPLPGDGPGVAGREDHERRAALARAEAHAAQESPTADAQADWGGRLRAHRVFMVLADNVRDYAVFLMDADGIIRFWGEGARLMKWWTKEQVEGAHLRLLYPEGGAEDGTAEGHLQAAAQFGEYTGEGRRVRSDGSTFWGGITLTALKDDDGELLGFAKVTRDFTARRAVEAALKAGQAAVEGQRIAEEANRLKALFVAMISHEVRAPLTALLGSVQLLGSEAAGPERQSAHLARIQNSGKHLLDVMNDLLDVSRLEAGRLPVNATAARLGGAVEAALAIVEPHAAAKGVKLSNAMSGAAADLPYWGDEARVRQIVVNLLSNAIKFTPADGQITLSGGTSDSGTDAELLTAGPWIYLRVEDTGEGIPPERLGAIFEPFEQARISDAERGSGLGLSISRRLARLMGGDLTVRSEVGSGSQFFLWLPVAPAHDVPR
jgi:PAS domain S-box-containing protein